jgi:hypothetical protein
MLLSVLVGGHTEYAPACSGAQLRVEVGLQGATGSLLGGAVLRNTGEACAVARVAAAIEQSSYRLAAAPPRRSAPVLLRRGQAAWVPLTWSNWCRSGPVRLVLRPGGHGAIVLPLSERPRCDDTQSPPKLIVGPVSRR